jgi:hypothetical protein
LWILTVLVICVGAVAGMLITLASEPNDIRVQLDTNRRTVAANEEFTIAVNVENVSLDPVTLNGVGLDRSLLDGLSVVRSDPPFRSITERDYPIYGAWSEFSLDQDMAEGTVFTLTLTLTATQPGLYEGDVTVWIENDVLGIVPVSRARRAPLEIQVQ